MTGDDFYGRIDELAHANDFLESRHSLVLSAPRRIGKSSFAKRLIEEKQASGWTCAYIDLEGVNSRERFLEILLDQFESSGVWHDTVSAAGTFLRRICDSVKEVGPVKLDIAQPDRQKDVFSSLSEVINHDKDTLIVIDELPLFMNVIDRQSDNHNEVAFLLNWFRSLRQVSGSRIRWIFCGSVGLQNFTRMRNLSMTINDMVLFDFDALAYPEARGLIRALADSEHVNISDEMTEYFLNRIEWHIPYFIQLLFNNIRTNKESAKGVTTDMIDDAFEKIARSTELNVWSERLSEYNGQEGGARLLLKELCKTDDGLSRDELLAVYSQYSGENPFKADSELSLILSMIEHDGYIVRSGDGLRKFRSPLLKRWWRYNFVE